MVDFNPFMHGEGSRAWRSKDGKTIQSTLVLREDSGLVMTEAHVEEGVFLHITFQAVED